MNGNVAQPLTNVMWDKGIVTLIVIALEVWSVGLTTVLRVILPWIAAEILDFVEN